MLAMNKNVIVTAVVIVIVALTDAMHLSSAPDNIPDNAYESVKRAGFVGMRGKKSEMEDDQSWPSFNNKRAGFVGMRGKKSYGFDNQSDLLQYLAALYQQKPTPGEFKRAGFVGMRGKKSITDESTLPKRAAFVGMRGRRTPSELGYDEPYLHYIQDMDDEVSQRETRAGFVGMRG